LKEKKLLGRLGVEGKILLNKLQINWIRAKAASSQGSDKWWAVAKMVIIPLAFIKCGNFLIS